MRTFNSKDAIQSHLDWLVNFQMFINGASHEKFDIERAKNDATCDFGRWLYSDESAQLLGIESHRLVKATHASFHEIAGQIASRINQCEVSGNDVKALMSELKFLSSQIVKILRKV